MENFLKEADGKRLCSHIHTYVSFDSVNSLFRILKYLENKSIDIAIISDHDSVEGGIRLKEISQHYKSKVEIIVGCEFKTSFGELIGFPVEKYLYYKDPHDLINYIHKKKGYIILPHPYSSHDLKMLENIASHVDMIEIHNARSNTKLDDMAVELCRRKKKIPIVGSDAHLISEIDLAINNFSNGINKYSFSYSPYNNIVLSQLIGSIKNKSILNILKYAFIYPFSFFWDLRRTK